MTMIKNLIYIVVSWLMVDILMVNNVDDLNGD